MIKKIRNKIHQFKCMKVVKMMINIFKILQTRKYNKKINKKMNKEQLNINNQKKKKKLSWYKQMRNKMKIFFSFQSRKNTRIYQHISKD